jgi:hypothetical protein
MPPKPPTQQMGEKHEEYLAKINAGRKTVASGSKWTDPGDGRNAHDLPYTFAWDGKSTHGKSLSVTLDMIAKIREQALGELPQIGLRWYATEDLREVHEDWVAVPGDAWEEILASARAWVTLETALGNIPVEDLQGLILKAGMVDGLRKSLADARDALLDAGEKIGAYELELHALRDIVKNAGQQPQPQAEQPPQAQWVPRLPWTVVHMIRKEGFTDHAAIHYREDGTQELLSVQSVRVERSVRDRPKMFLNDVIVRDGDLYVNGALQVRTCADDPRIETG